MKRQTNRKHKKENGVSLVSP